MSSLVLFVEPLPYLLEERDRCLEDPGHPQELTLFLTGASPCGELPAAPVLFELSSGLPLLMRSSGDPFLPLAGSQTVSQTLGGTEVLLSIPPASILKIVT